MMWKPFCWAETGGLMAEKAGLIFGLVLAAGSSRRFGEAKLVQPVAGVALVRRSVGTLLDAGLEVVVVAGPDSGDVRGVLAGLDVRIVDHAGAAEGMACSIACGVAALPPTADAVVILPGDQPATPAGLVEELCRLYRDRGAAGAAPVYRGVQGPPVLFSRSLFPELMSLAGDRGARSLVESHAGAFAFTAVDGPMPRDIDTREDREAVASQEYRSI